MCVFMGFSIGSFMVLSLNLRFESKVSNSSLGDPVTKSFITGPDSGSGLLNDFCF